MRKSFANRVVVVALIVSLIANPAWAGMIMVGINPAAGSTRPKTQAVLGHGTLMVMNDDVTNWNWKFGFGVKDANGRWRADFEQPFTPNLPNPATPTTTTWGKTLNAPPWNVSPNQPPPMQTMYIPDHFARVTRDWALNNLGQTIVDETAMHTVTN